MRPVVPHQVPVHGGQRQAGRGEGGQAAEARPPAQTPIHCAGGEKIENITINFMIGTVRTVHSLVHSFTNQVQIKAEETNPVKQEVKPMV